MVTTPSCVAHHAVLRRILISADPASEKLLLAVDLITCTNYNLTQSAMEATMHAY